MHSDKTDDPPKGQGLTDDNLVGGIFLIELKSN